MELRSKLNVTSSWTESASLQDILYFIDKSGCVVDSSYKTIADYVVLSQCVADEACYIHVRKLKSLLGYTVMGVGLQSGSRNVEVYVGDEYVSTCRGSLMEEATDQPEKLFASHLDLPSEYHYSDGLSLKLLSLKGQPTVKVRRVTVTLSEDHDGRTTELMTPQNLLQGAHPGQLQELLDSLPSLSTNAPPFLGSLISTLKSCQTSREGRGTMSATTAAAAAAATVSGQPSLPPEVAYMMSAFHSMRPKETETTAEPEATNEDTEGGDEGSPKEQTTLITLDQVESLLDAKMQQLEARLIKYINSKFDEMSMKALETDLKVEKEIDSDILTMHRDEVCESAEHNQYHNTLCRPED